jgi:hypothetical protein
MILCTSLVLLANGCWICRAVDDRSLADIAKTCRLLGAKIVLEGGHRVVWLDARYGDQSSCVAQEMKKKNLAGGVYLDDSHLPPPTAGERKCVDDIMRKEGPTGLDHINKCIAK